MTVQLQTAPAAFDADRAERFAERMAQAMNDGALMIMVSIGHRTGLFDVMAKLPPATSDDIAKAADLIERYVREWLAAMVTGRVVEYDPANRNYHRFHEVMAEDSGQTVVAALFDVILPLVPGLEKRLEAGIDVLDAGCGFGRALHSLAERFPRSRFVGYDLSAEAIERASAVAAAKNLGNLRFEARDLTGFNERAAYDLILTFDAVHDQKDPEGLLRGIAGALRSGGVYLMQDIAGSSRLENNLDHPFGTLLYTVSCMHCMPVSLGQGGAGLGAMWGEELAETMLREAGFRSIERRRLEHDPLNVYFIARVW